jgi:uncharacterized membrane protein YdbT with pleckstrin-like domain
MEDRIIRASMKTTWAAYGFALLVIIAGVWAYFSYAQDQPRWLLAVPLLVLVFPLSMHLKRLLITLRLEEHHLTLESGLISRTRRTVDMAKIQDVTVRQSLAQRMLGIGDLILEDSGKSGAMGIRNLDRPREIADSIIAGSKRSPITITHSEPEQS